MIVAIINQTSPSGVVRVRVFREADTEADAVDDFVDGYDPPKDPNDWLGFDTGWSTFQNPSAGTHWGYDFDSPGLVEVDNTETLEVCQVLCFDGQDKAVTLDGSWQTLYQFVLNPEDICDPDRFIMRARFAYRSTGGDPQLRFTENNSLYGSAEVLTDQGGWTRAQFRAAQTPLANMNTYALEGDMAGASLFELRGVTVEILKRTS
jgi:hypothetical protein